MIQNDTFYLIQINNGQIAAESFRDSNGHIVRVFNFDDGVVVRETIVPHNIAQPPGQVIVGTPVKRKLEYLAPESIAGQILHEEYFND